MAGQLKDKQTETFSISELDEVGFVRRFVTQTAGELGFDSIVQEELAIIATELGVNLVKHHAVDGQVSIRPFFEDETSGIEIIASDSGPGIPDVGEAQCDGFSTAGSMGCGLGAVKRLSDEFDIFSSTPDQEGLELYKNGCFEGTIVISRRFLTPPKNSVFRHSFRSQPRVAWDPNGDGVVAIGNKHKLLVGVSDGLGHGAKANRSTARVMDTLKKFHHESIPTIFQKLHEGLRGERGAAVALSAIDLEKGVLTHGGVGNVTTRLVGKKKQTLFSTPGICGVEPYHPPKINQCAWNSCSSIWMFTDGLFSRWDLDDHPEFFSLHPALVSFLLMTRLARDNDDATVAVIRES